MVSWSELVLPDSMQKSWLLTMFIPTGTEGWRNNTEYIHFKRVINHSVEKCWTSRHPDRLIVTAWQVDEPWGSCYTHAVVVQMIGFPSSTGSTSHFEMRFALQFPAHPCAKSHIIYGKAKWIPGSNMERMARVPRTVWTWTTSERFIGWNSLCFVKSVNLVKSVSSSRDSIAWTLQTIEWQGCNCFFSETRSISS